VVPASGNVWIGGQQVWLGPALSGRQITLWVDAISLHVLLDGTRIKTLPSRLGMTELARLAASGARPAGPSRLPAGDGAVIEVDRTVNATGLVSLGDQQVGVGSPLAGQRVTLRMEGPLMAVLGHDGSLLRTLACPFPADRRFRLRGARRARSLPPQPGGPITVQRRVSSRGGLMGRPPEDPRRDEPCGQDRHRDLRKHSLPGDHRRRDRRRGAPHHHQRSPPLQSQRHRQAHPAPAHPGRTVILMPEVKLDAVDAAELAEMLQFLSEWLARDPARLAVSLAEFVGHPAYGLAQLRGDLERFAFLLGGSDGEQLFGP
jgi:hypothetical protein